MIKLQQVLVVPLRVVPRLKDLNLEESIDYIKTIQLIHRFIEKLYKADSLNIAMQDGIAAGQSVPHVHTHIIPRYLIDSYGDGIYDLLEKNENNLNSFYQTYCKPLTVLDDEIRKPRAMEIMQDEANWLSVELEKFIKDSDDEQIKLSHTHDFICILLQYIYYIALFFIYRENYINCFFIYLIYI